MKIENLDKKLNGELPVTREELLELVNSWGRTTTIITLDSNGNYITMIVSEPTEKYNLSKLDVSQITNFDDIFANSLFEGDISNWDTSNATSMDKTFLSAERFNSPLPWDTSNVTSINETFAYAEKFNQPLNWNTINVTSACYTFCHARNFNQPLNWNTINVASAVAMLYNANNFEHPINFDVSNLHDYDFMLASDTFIKKFNNGVEIKNPKKWIEENRDRMKELLIINTLESNQKAFDDTIKEKNIVVGSPMYNSLLESYNETQEELKGGLEELRKKDVEIATNNLEL